MSSQPVVIAHTADLHFGRRMAKVTHEGENVREGDIYRAAQTVAEYIANTVKPDVVVNAGDHWDTSHPTPRAAKHGYNFAQVLREADIPHLVVGGNHDTLSALGRPTPLEHLKFYFGASLALEQSEIEIAGIRFCCVPYRSLSLGELRPPEYASDVPNVLVVHAAADGDNLPDFAQYDPHRLPRSTLFDPKSALRLLGHIHVHQDIGELAYYSGALERLTWGEIGNRPSIYVHRVYPDGRVETESIPVDEMGVEGVPRPALDLALDCAELEPDAVIDAGLALLEANTLDDHLVQLTLDAAPRDVYAFNFEDALTKRATQRGALTLKVRVRMRNDADDAYAAATQSSATDPVPGAALSDAYRAFARDQGDDDLADLGAELIAVTSGEKGA